MLDDYGELLGALGFRPVAAVAKTRRVLEIPWQSKVVEAALDDVRGLGTYLELELSAEEGGLDTAKACLASLAEALGVTLSERRSYLELLLAKD